MYEIGFFSCSCIPTTIPPPSMPPNSFCREMITSTFQSPDKRRKDCVSPRKPYYMMLGFHSRLYLVYSLGRPSVLNRIFASSKVNLIKRMDEDVIVFFLIRTANKMIGNFVWKKFLCLHNSVRPERTSYRKTYHLQQRLCCYVKCLPTQITCKYSVM